MAKSSNFWGTLGGARPLLWPLTVLLAYMVSPLVGFVASAALAVHVFRRSAASLEERLLTLLVVTLPLYSVPILPRLHHSVSWSSLLLVAITVVVGRYRVRIPPSIAVALLTISVLVPGANAIIGSPAGAIYYSLQYLLFVVPLTVVALNRHVLLTTMTRAGILRVTMTLAWTLIAASVGVVIQAGVHRITGYQLGQISFFRTRTVYDLTINAFSVLSMLLAVGIALAPALFYLGHRKLAAFMVISCGVAIILNTSRTGLVVGSAVLIMALLSSPAPKIRRLTVAATIVVIPVLGWAYALLASLSGRAIGLLDDNGRFATYINGLNEWLADFPTTLIGTSYAVDEKTNITPHNFVIESLLRSGPIVTVALLTLIAALYISIRSSWRYPILTLILGSLFYSGFYAVKAMPIIAMVAVLASQAFPTVGMGLRPHRAWLMGVSQTSSTVQDLPRTRS